MTDNNLVNDSGKINKGELIKRALENVDTVSVELLYDGLLEFAEVVKEGSYLSLNSREINYMQIFITEGCTPKQVAMHILDYLSESSFVTTSEDSVLIPTNSIKHHNMIDVKDFEVLPKEERMDLYIDGHYFKLQHAGWQVENILDMQGDK